MKKQSKAQIREATRVAAQKAKNKKIIIVILIGVILVGGVLLTQTKNEPQIGNETSVTKVGDIIILKEDVIKEGYKLYPYKIDGVDMEVLAVKASDGTVRTAFNTCHECKGTGKGYFTIEGAELKCQNCGNKFSFDEVETVSGGCNPIAIGHTHETAESVIVEQSVMQESKDLFRNWKTR